MQQLTIWDAPGQSGNPLSQLLFPNPRKAEKFQRLAEGMESTIEAKLYPPIASLNLTRRRARIAESMRVEGERLALIQSWLYALANWAMRGDMPLILEGISTKTQLEVLATVASWNESQISDLFADSNSDWELQIKLKSARIHTPRHLKQVLALLSSYSTPATLSPQQQTTLQVQRLRQEAIWQKVQDFFPTPPHLIEEMLNLANLQPGMKTLEPSAGSGDICLALREEGIEPDCFEVSSMLRETLKLQGFSLIGQNFLTEDPQPHYSRIIANPPFSKGLAVVHTQKAYEWLAPEGRLVTLINRIENPQRRREQQFRQWLTRVNVTELHRDSAFQDSDRPTSVSVSILVIDKP